MKIIDKYPYCRSFGHSYDSCNYFAFYSIEDVADAIGSDNLMVSP